MSPAGAPDRSPRRHLAAGLFVSALALIAALVAGVLVAAAVNPGYDRHLYYLKGAVPTLLIAGGVGYAAAWLLGARRVLGVVVSFLLPAAATVAVFAYGYAERPDREADVARALAFQRTIDPYPGSARVSTYVFGMYPSGDSVAEGFLNPSPGYGVTLTYRLPAGATKQQAVAHYRRELRRHGWSVRVSENCSGDDVVYEVCGQSVVTALDDEGNGVVSVAVYRRRSDHRVFVDV